MPVRKLGQKSSLGSPCLGGQAGWGGASSMGKEVAAAGGVAGGGGGGGGGGDFYKGGEGGEGGDTPPGGGPAPSRGGGGGTQLRSQRDSWVAGSKRADSFAASSESETERYPDIPFLGYKNSFLRSRDSPTDTREGSF